MLFYEGRAVITVRYLTQERGKYYYLKRVKAEIDFDENYECLV